MVTSEITTATYQNLIHLIGDVRWFTQWLRGQGDIQYFWLKCHLTNHSTNRQLMRHAYTWKVTLYLVCIPVWLWSLICHLVILSDRKIRCPWHKWTSMVHNLPLWSPQVSVKPQKMIWYDRWIGYWAKITPRLSTDKAKLLILLSQARCTHICNVYFVYYRWSGQVGCQQWRIKGRSPTQRPHCLKYSVLLPWVSSPNPWPNTLK